MNGVSKIPFVNRGGFYKNVRWDDLRVPLNALTTGPTKSPGFAKYKDNGAGSDGIFIYFFDAGSEEQLFFAAQLPHTYKEGTILKPHIHWIPSAAGGAGEVVNWGLEYAIKSAAGVFGNTTIISANSHAPADSSLAQDKHYITGLPDISGSGLTISAMIIGRLFRDAGGVLGTDDYGADAGLLEIDFHFEKDADGSRQEYIK